MGNTMTWRTFTTRINADRYELACWLILLRRRAAEGDGTLLNVATRLREQFAGSWPDDFTSVKATVQAMTRAQLDTFRAKLDRLPVLGRRNGVIVDTDGFTLRWDVPRLTAAGTWAVQCPPFDNGGGPEPVWPPAPVLT